MPVVFYHCNSQYLEMFLPWDPMLRLLLFRTDFTIHEIAISIVHQPSVLFQPWLKTNWVLWNWKELPQWVAEDWTTHLTQTALWTIDKVKEGLTQNGSGRGGIEASSRNTLEVNLFCSVQILDHRLKVEFGNSQKKTHWSCGQDHELERVSESE